MLCCCLVVLQMQGMCQRHVHGKAAKMLFVGVMTLVSVQNHCISPVLGRQLGLHSTGVLQLQAHGLHQYGCVVDVILGNAWCLTILA